MDPTKTDYQAKMDAQLKEWSARLATLQAKAEKASAETKKALLADLEELKKLEASGRQLATTTWGEVKADLTDKWNHVSGAVDAIWARVSK